MQTSQSSKTNQAPHTMNQPPIYPKRFGLTRAMTQPKFDLLREIQNICVKISLFQAIKDIPIYAKIVKELCIRKLGRKPKDPPTIHVIGRLA